MSGTVDGVAKRSESGDRVRVTRTESVPEGSRVRHFDQLDERTQDAVASIDGAHAVFDAPELTTGDVVVFTDYYRVE